MVCASNLQARVGLGRFPADVGRWYHQHHQHRHLHLPPPAPPPAEKWSTSCAGEASEVLLELTQELLAALLLLVYRRTPRCGSRTGREKLGRPYAHLPLAADRHTPIRGHHPMPPHPLTPLITPPAPLLHHQQCHRQAVNHRPHQDEGRTRRGRGGGWGQPIPRHGVSRFEGSLLRRLDCWSVWPTVAG